MSFLYIILAVIAIILYLIYRRLKTPTLPPKTDDKETLLNAIDAKGTSLLNKLKTSHLKDYLTTQAVLFDCGKQNFIRLSERFKHDEAKFAETAKDWSDYLELLSDTISESEMLDVCTSDEDEEHFKARDEMMIRLQEINKRFKVLLADDYIDPAKQLGQQPQTMVEIRKQQEEKQSKQ